MHVSFSSVDKDGNTCQENREVYANGPEFPPSKPKSYRRENTESDSVRPGSGVPIMLHVDLEHADINSCCSNEESIVSFLRSSVIKSAVALVAGLYTCTALAHVQYLGVTFGFNYTKQTEIVGPDTGTFNTPLYNPDASDPDATWDTWVRELGQSGVNFVAPNLRGAYPLVKWSPAGMLPILKALERTGFSSQVKIALFDDNASSWKAQWNQAQHSRLPFDISASANWSYIYDTNYKVFFETVPDANRFKIDGRPVIIIWTGNPATVSNEQGNYSRAITYVRERCKADFGFDPYIIVNTDALDQDKTLASVVDAAHHWTGGGNKGAWSLTDFKQTKIGVAFPGLFAPSSPNFRDPDHGGTLKAALAHTVGAGALLTLVEGFTDFLENAALFRVRNLDDQGHALGYPDTLYDYPNQRLNILRSFSQEPFSQNTKFEAEGADSYGNAKGGNGKVNYYRNGDIAIELTTDAEGGFNVGWMQPGEWLEWESIPVKAGSHVLLRIATPNAGRRAHLVIDDIPQPSRPLPNTGGWQHWMTYDLGVPNGATDTYHKIRIVFDNGGVNFNWWKA